MAFSINRESVEKEIAGWSGPPQIDIEDVEFSYRSGHTILRDVNIHLKGPGLVSILGPNGVGKSTLVKCVNHLIKPSSGTIKINGVDVSSMSRKEISKLVAFVPASSNDVFSMPVLDAVMVGRYNKAKMGRAGIKEDLAKVSKVLEMLDLSDLAMRGYNQLSAGQHQKVSIARGIVQETPILILDEPTSNLDVKHQVYISQLMRALAEETNMLIITIFHDLNIAAKYSNEVIVLAKPGVVYATGKPSEILTPKLIREVYGIDSRVETEDGYPYVVLQSTIYDDDGVPEEEPMTEEERAELELKEERLKRGYRWRYHESEDDVGDHAGRDHSGGRHSGGLRPHQRRRGREGRRPRLARRDPDRGG